MANAERLVTEVLESFDTLRARIMDRYDGLSPHLQRLARVALEDPNVMALETVASIATRAGVQPSTLIRFGKELGYDGFSALQKVFKLRLIEGAPLYREQVFAAQQGSAGGDLLDRCVDAQIASLERLKRTTSREDVDRAVAILAGADHVLVAGLRRSRPIAAYLSYGLTRQERRCGLVDFDGGMAAQQVANMRAGDVLAAIAFPEYARPVVEVVREAHLRHIPVIAITDGPASPLALNADVAFFTDHATGGAFRPISGAIGLVQTLIESLTT